MSASMGTPRNATPSEAAMPRDVLYAERRDLATRRGLDGLKTFGVVFYPRTTIGDVVTLTTRWNTRVAAFLRDHLGAISQAIDEWRALVTEVEAQTRDRRSEAPYPRTRAWWDTTTRVASAMSDVLTLEATQRSLAALGGETFAHAIAMVSDAPRAVGHAAAAVARGVGDLAGGVAGGFARGALDALIVPLAIGGGAIGLYALTRRRPAEAS